MIRSENLKFQYSSAKNELTFPTIHVDKNKHTLLLGESGSGKTTLLHLLGGLSAPTAGQVFIDSHDIYALSEEKRDLFRAKNMGFIFQDAHLLKNLTIEENIILAQYLAKVKQDRNAVITVLDKLQIKDKANSYPNQLSRGQLQRAAIARAVINHPKVLIADEPTAALDDTNTKYVMDLLMETAATFEVTLLIATHDTRIKSYFANTYQL
ncbi:MULTISPECIES: ATP-binding cassette domain-containing protein [Sphingobacterium]|uniref:ATP-binding cassette domain-containing protein n=1 Tax=Sphingobacterium litopenaei TaxID=2763500 RepID=A0ABR7YCM0_9SPHI|nr:MULTISPECIES: ATP-binding cassette domain-containing protein [Sphingobacterium]MBD1429035.1 ATP-binding cassette domain-containing protein [Sphingobacterium litopenaei]NGM72383.1 ATP-binding cassette domain-containing protein [Sphingobacterium sp. SGL-16]